MQSSLNDLTPRERQVLFWLAEGKSSYETGVILGCAEATVKKHRFHICRTLEVPNAISAARLYLDAMALERTGRRYANSPAGELHTSASSL